MERALPHGAGLNPGAWRLYANAAAPCRPRARNVLDTDLLLRFLALDKRVQVERGQRVEEGGHK